MTREAEAYFQAENTQLKAVCERMQSQIDELIQEQVAFMADYTAMIEALRRRIHVLEHRGQDE